jgi:hypothetical protein
MRRSVLLPPFKLHAGYRAYVALTCCYRKAEKLLGAGGVVSVHTRTNLRLSKAASRLPLPVRTHDRLRWLLAAIEKSYIRKTN